MTDHPPGNRKSIDVLVAELRRFLASQDPEDDQADLVKYREKVIDVSLLFAPTPEESAAIAIREDTPSMNLVRECATQLGISNIRVIVLIKRLTQQLEPLLRDFDPRILTHANLSGIVRRQRGGRHGRACLGFRGLRCPSGRRRFEHARIDPYTGDILQDNPQSTGRHDRHNTRWVGVVLHKVTGAAELSSSARGQHRRKQKSGESAPPNEARPFTATDVIAAGTLSRALDKLVFSHPEVRLLCRMAISVSDVRQISFEEDAGLVVLVLGYDEPLLPLRYFTYLVEQPDEPPPAGSTEDEAIWAEYFRRELPPELQAYYHAVQHRADTLIEMLQQQQVVARGHTADGRLVQIAHSIWSHPEYYVHPPTGDI